MATLFNSATYQPRGIESPREVARGSYIDANGDKQYGVSSDPKTKTTYTPFNYDVDETIFREEAERERQLFASQNRERRQYRREVITHSMEDARDERRANAYNLRVLARALERRGLIVEARDKRREADKLEGLVDMD
jgi:hypothetical protein